MKERWGIFCFDCKDELEIGRLVEKPGDSGNVLSVFELFYEGDVHLWQLQAYFVRHLGHELSVVDTNVVVSALEHLEPMPYTYGLDESPLGSLPVDVGESWADEAGGRRLLDWLKSFR